MRRVLRMMPQRGQLIVAILLPFQSHAPCTSEPRCPTTKQSLVLRNGGARRSCPASCLPNIHTMAPMPRLIIVRHGETEWSLNGRHTGRSDIPLTARGESQINTVAPSLVGDGKLIDCQNLHVVLVSPRIRAHKTFHIMFEHLPKPPAHIITEQVREWDYGDYEGLLSAEIREKNPNWNIWRDGCPGGESVEAMTIRVDSVISQVREYHRKWKEEGEGSRDVVIVAHGHFNRCLIARWIEQPLCNGTFFNVEPAGIAILSYNHDNLAEPALNALNLNALG